MTAIEKIEAQQKGRANTDPVRNVGEQLKAILLHEPEYEELVSRDLDIANMSLEHAEKQIRHFADEQQRKGKANCVCVPPKVAENIIREFYGIPKAAARPKYEEQPEKSNKIDLADFL